MIVDSDTSIRQEALSPALPPPLPQPGQVFEKSLVSNLKI